MWGSDYFKMINGDWDHVGTVATNHLQVPVGGMCRRGTFVNYQAGAAGQDVESEVVLASGFALGLLTQDVDEYGLDTDANFRKQYLGLQDYPIKKGAECSVRRPTVKAEMEFEGLGAAAAGNLVATTGTGGLATTTAVNTELSVLNGCIRQAQTGEFVLFLLKDADITPKITGNRRIRVETVSPYKKA